MKKATPQLWMKDVDYRFFNYLHSVKVALYEQINRDVYGYDNIFSLYKRLRKFKNLGLVRRYFHEDFARSKVVGLTNLGFTKFVANGTELKTEVGSNAIGHDVGLVEVRHQLMSAANVNAYHTENSLRTWQHYSDEEDFFPYVQMRCDGAVDVSYPEGMVRFAVEYEASAKFSSRYKDVFQRYYQAEEIPLVLYICKHTELMKELILREKRWFDTARPKLFYKTLDDLKQDKTLTFTSRLGERLAVSINSGGAKAVQC